MCLKLMHVLLEHIPLHEQGPMHSIIDHADGGGVGFGVNSKHLRKVKTSAIIMCSSYNVF
jgi:hypothetical protein